MKKTFDFTHTIEKSALEQLWELFGAMLLLIDNYDSFVYNLAHYLGMQGAEVEVHRNDALSVSEAFSKSPSHIVLSPGPCTPNEAGICLDLIGSCKTSCVPLLGVCLGHQAIAQAFDGRIIRTTPMHGKVSPILHKGESVFLGLPSPFLGTRYHSLIAERETLPPELLVTAETQDGIIMGLQHRTLPIAGVQFHPESIATEHGHALLKNFLSQSMPVPRAA